MSFANKVVIITGASSGIGWSLARELGREGAKVGLLARRQQHLEKLAEQIEKDGGTAAHVPADITNRAETVSAIRALREELGPVDLLVANAGLGKPTYLDQSNIHVVEEMFKVNVLGMIYSFEAVLPEMVERKQGHLAGVSSLAAYRGLPGESGYCASKAAVSSYLEGLRLELRPHNVAVTTICPGFVTTPMTEQHDFKMPFVMESDEAARRIARALRRRVKVFNFPWQTRLLMRLTQWLPEWFLYRRLACYIKEPENKQADQLDPARAVSEPARH